MKITLLSIGFCSLYKGPRFHWKILWDILTGGDNIENHYTKWLMALWGSSHIGLVILITNYFISHPHFLPVHPRRDNENKQLKERCWCVEDLGQLQDSSCSSAGFVVKASLLDLIFPGSLLLVLSCWQCHIWRSWRALMESGRLLTYAYILKSLSSYVDMLDSKLNTSMVSHE